MNRYLHIIVITAATALLASGEVDMSYASDGKTYAGANCKQVNLNGNRYDATGRAWNTRTPAGTSSWVCPVVRDSIHSNVESAAMRVLDANNSYNFACWVDVRDNEAGLISWKKDTSSGDNPSKPKKLSWSGLSGYDYGYINIRCNVPNVDTQDGNQSAIVSYRVTEI